METYCVGCKKLLRTKTQILEKLNTIDQCFYPILLFLARKNQPLLKIKNSTALIIFEMISLKWIKSLTNFYWLKTNLCQNFN